MCAITQVLKEDLFFVGLFNRVGAHVEKLYRQQSCTDTNINSTE